MVKLPNILITGVPGTGKSTLSTAVVDYINKRLKEKYGESCQTMKHVQMSKLIEEYHLYHERDEDLDATIFDDTLVDDILIQMNVKEGGYVLDFHDTLCCVNYVDHVFVLITRTEVLYDRLVQRNYMKNKIETNMECLIFNEIQSNLEDYPLLFKKENSLSNNDEMELKNNVHVIGAWILNNVKT